MTQLVKASGLTWAAVDAIVWHGAEPRYDNAKKIAEAVGCAVDDVYCKAEPFVVLAPTGTRDTIATPAGGARPVAADAEPEAAE